MNQGDKVANAFSKTQASPEEFMALSLFTICVHSIQTQVIDSQNRSAAIFMIDKIESQFSRLYENEKTNKLMFSETTTPDFHASNLNKNTRQQKSIKLSCISEEHSKTSIRCFKKENEIPSQSNDRLKMIKNSIMYECAFERISIKAVKKLNDQNKLDMSGSPIKTTTSNKDEPELPKIAKEMSSISSKNSLSSETDQQQKIINEDGQNTEKTSFLVKQKLVKNQVNFKDKELVSTPSSDVPSELEKQEHNRLSISEFEICKIWFSFPEPPISPKGKRKIPYTRFDWNLLSSVSPAVTSWLCASKHSLQPLKVSSNY